MKLLSLKVEHFRAIRKAKIEFASGLNVLHGPNDLGKSSLAQAIRAALLLQTNAKEGDAFASWHAAEDPHVELVFESEPQKIWRVKKTFGTASALLEWSRDGIDFAHEARARQVDERLSEILRWGVAPPGGKGRPKGMPATFLTTALLPEQDRVDAIFNQVLAEDSDDSGKKRLIAALQAMAEDPLFKSVLAIVQERVDEAFNVSDEKVTRKRGKSSPWVKLNEEIQVKQRRNDEWEQRLRETSAIEEDIQVLRERRLELKEAADEAEGRKAALREDLEKVERRREIETRLEDRKGRLEVIEKELKDLRAAELLHGAAALWIEDLKRDCEEARLARDDAYQSEQKTNAEWARLQNEDSVRQRQLEQSGLEARRAELESEQLRLEASLAKVRAVEAAAETVERIRGELSAMESSAAELKRESEAAGRSRAAAEEEEHDLRSVRAWLQWQTARDEVRQAEKGVEQLNDWRKQALEKRDAAAALDAAQPVFTLPSSERLEGLRRLEGEMRVAAAKLDVGLLAVVRPRHPLRLGLQRDGGERTSRDLNDGSVEASARRNLTLDIEDVAEIVISGGAADAREEFETLERRWEKEAKPLLDQASVGTIEQLTRLASEAAKRRSELENALRDAAQLEQRMADQPDWGRLIAERHQSFKVAGKALMGGDPSKLEKASRKFRVQVATDADKRLEALRVKLDRLAAEGRQCGSDLAAEDARVAEKKRALDEAQADLERKQSAIAGEWREALRQIEETQEKARKDLYDVQEKLKRLANAGDESLASAKSAVDAARDTLENSEAAHSRAQQTLSDALLDRAAEEGSLKARREAAAKLDEKGAREAFEQVAAELRSAPAPEIAVTPEMLAEAEKICTQAAGRLDEIDGKIREKQGALQQVGGEVARQKAEDAASELALSKERASQTELEYDAWELLRKTLREAEQEEGTNLGRALANPVTDRFAALTGSRYGKLDLGPNLETNGISVDGETRFIDLLSVGTRDQLSTIFRLTLAEQLKTAIILDDQLTQTDGDRMSWLRGLLNEVAKNIQVIVLTCRPEDYRVQAGGRSRSKQPPVHSVDLLQSIERWHAAAGA